MTPGLVLAWGLGALWEGTVLAVLAIALMTMLRVRAPRLRQAVFVALLLKCVVPAPMLFVAITPAETALRAYWTMPPEAVAIGRDMALLVAPVSATPFGGSLAPALLSVWALTAAWLLGRRVRATLALSSLVGQSRVVTGGRVAEALCRALRARGTSRCIRVAVSPQTGSAFAWGTLKPVIVLPAHLVDDLDDDELEAVVQHELSHVGRFDGVTAWVTAAVTCLAWPHPLAWWLAREAEREREFACDREASALGRTPVPLARGLAKAVRAAATSVAAATPAMASGDVARRLDRLLRGTDTREPAWRRRVLVAGVALCAALIAAGANPCLRP